METKPCTTQQVETEQIVADGVHGALHESGLCAAVQLRGSIPLVWGHGEQKQIVPRPDIHLQRCACRSIERSPSLSRVPQPLALASPARTHARRLQVRSYVRLHAAPLHRTAHEVFGFWQNPAFARLTGPVAGPQVRRSSICRQFDPTSAARRQPRCNSWLHTLPIRS